jgi:hypothetical protein
MKLSKASLFSLVALVCFGITGLSSNSVADDGAPFGDRNLVGSYAVQLNEGIWAPGPPPINFALDAVGVVSFDGNGNANGTLVVNLGGPDQSPQITCTGTLTATYSVNPDGTGTFNDSTVYAAGCPLSPSKASHSLVMANYGKTVFLAVTTVPSGSQIGTITLIRQ